MTMKYVGFAVFIFICGSFLGAIADGLYLGDQSDLAQLTSLRLMQMPMATSGDINLPSPNLDFFKALWNITTFNFAFMPGSWQLLRWFVFMPLAAMFVYGLAVMFISILKKTV